MFRRLLWLAIFWGCGSYAMILTRELKTQTSQGSIRDVRVSAELSRLIEQAQLVIHRFPSNILGARDNPFFHCQKEWNLKLLADTSKVTRQIDDYFELLKCEHLELRGERLSLYWCLRSLHGSLLMHIDFLKRTYNWSF